MKKMKKRLVSLKQNLIKKQSVYIPNKNNKKIIDIVSSLEVDFALHHLKKGNIDKENNNYIIDKNNMIFFYPVNDGYPRYLFKYYKNNKLIISNQKVFSEIINLDSIILQMIRIFDKALDEGYVIDPYYFMLKLHNKMEENYKGTATLIITEKAIRNQKLNKDNFDEANKYYINHFLDHFIGWNFGVSINRNITLQNELEALNNKVIEKGIREFAGTGYEVYGTGAFAHSGLQHYHLPVKNDTKKKIKK